MKTFGSHNARPAAREPFELKYMDASDRPATFTGLIVVRSSGSDLANILRAVKTSSQDVVPELIKLLTKLMDDSDGVVPRKWAPKQLDKPVDLDPEELADWEPVYRGPDGILYAVSDEPTLAKWKDVNNWSTRRRWVAFMEEDDEAVVELEDLMSIMEWVIGLAAERPTRPRA